MLNIFTYLKLVYKGINSVFYHWTGIYRIFGVDLVAFISVVFGISCVFKLLTNTSFNPLSRLYDIPKRKSR